MRTWNLAVATVLTLGYAFVATAAMTADRNAIVQRVLATTAVTTPAGDIKEGAAAKAAAGRLWYGGTLPSITVIGRGVPLFNAAGKAVTCRQLHETD